MAAHIANAMQLEKNAGTSLVDVHFHCTCRLRFVSESQETL